MVLYGVCLIRYNFYFAESGAPGRADIPTGKVGKRIAGGGAPQITLNPKTAFAFSEKFFWKKKGDTAYL